MAKNLVNLNEFDRFGIADFLEGKSLVAVGAAEELPNYDTGEIEGVKATIEIAEDKTPYRSKSGKDNVGGRFDVKILGKDVKDYAWMGYRVPVTVVDVTDAKRWSLRDNGNRNQLTVTGDVRKAKA